MYFRKLYPVVDILFNNWYLSIDGGDVLHIRWRYCGKTSFELLFFVWISRHMTNFFEAGGAVL
jgi:hypothetical protein